MGLQEKASKAFYNALRRGKTSVYNYHRDDAETLMAEMKEFAEASEDKKSEHLPEYTEAQEELADIIIGCMTELFKRGVNIGIIDEPCIADIEVCGLCYQSMRSDNKSVIFKQINKRE